MSIKFCCNVIPSVKQTNEHSTWCFVLCYMASLFCRSIFYIGVQQCEQLCVIRCLSCGVWCVWCVWALYVDSHHGL